MVKKLTLLCLICFLITNISFGQELNSKTESIFKETLIDKIHTNADLQNIATSPDAKHVAYIAWEERKPFVVVDGKKGKQYDAIGKASLVFSPDSKRVVYAAEAGNKWFVVVNGEEGKKYGGIWAAALPTFSPDGKRVAYGATEDKKMFLVVNGKEGKRYDAIGSIVFSPNSERIAYGVVEGNKVFPVINGQEGDKYDDILRFAPFTFSLDSTYIAYGVLKDNEYFMVIEGMDGRIEEGPYEEVRNILFSPNSDRIAYYAKKEGKWSVLEKSLKMPQKITRYDSNYIGSFIYSPDGERLAYATIRMVPLSDNDYGLHAFILTSFVIMESATEKKTGEGYGSIFVYPTFSPDGKKVAYVAEKKDGYVIVIDNKEEKISGGPFTNITFSPDSKHVVYASNLRTFSPGSRNRVAVEIDGKRRRDYEGIFSSIVFDSPNKFHYIAKKENAFLFVEEWIE